MAVEQVRKTLRERPLTSGDAETKFIINRELVPVVQEMRTRLNELLGVVFWTPTETQTSDYTAEIGDMVKADPTIAGFTVTLPDPSTANSGQSIWLKNVSASANVITVECSALVDGATSAAISGSYCSMIFVSDGTTWWKLGSFGSL